jgi:hypothetical protein
MTISELAIYKPGHIGKNSSRNIAPPKGLEAALVKTLTDDMRLSIARQLLIEQTNKVVDQASVPVQYIIDFELLESTKAYTSCLSSLVQIKEDGMYLYEYKLPSMPISIINYKAEYTYIGEGRPKIQFDPEL